MSEVVRFKGDIGKMLDEAAHIVTNKGSDVRIRGIVTEDAIEMLARLAAKHPGIRLEMPLPLDVEDDFILTRPKRLTRTSE